MKKQSLSLKKTMQNKALWLAVPTLAFLVVFFLVPVFRLMALSIQDPINHSLTASHYMRLFNTEVYWRILLITFRISAITAVLCVALGYPLAYWLANQRGLWRNRILILVLLPFWTSYLVKSFSWMLLLGNEGVINRLAMGLGLTKAPWPLMYNEFGVIIGMVHAMMPLAILTLMPVLSGIDSRLSPAAGTLGAGRSQRFWMVYFPLSIPGIAAGGLLTFITSLGFFIVPAFLGGRQQTMLSQLIILQVQELVNWAFAGVLAAMLLVTALLACWIYNAVFGLSSLSAGQSKDLASNKSLLRRGILILLELWSHTIGFFINRLPLKIPFLGIYGWLCLIFLIIPTILVVPLAFTSSNFLELPPPGFSLKWFETYLNSPIWISATLRSFGVALVTAIIATILGGLAALALARSQTKWSGVIFVFMLAPMIVPRIVIAVGLFYLFAQIGLVATNTGLIIGHTVLAIPYTFVAMAAVLKSYDWRLDQAALSMGANRLQVLGKVTVPLISGSIVSAFLFAFITSFDELTIAIFVSGGLKTTLPKQMWDDMILQLNPTLAAVSVVVLTVVTIILLLADRLRRTA